MRRRHTEDAHAPGVGGEQPEHDAQQRALAAAVWPYQAQELAFFHFQTDVLERGHAIIGERDVFQHDDRGRHCIASANSRATRRRLFM